MNLFYKNMIPSTELLKEEHLNTMQCFGGATGVTDTTSGRLFLAPVPDSTYVFKIHYEAIPDRIIWIKYYNLCKSILWKWVIICMFMWKHMGI